MLLEPLMEVARAHGEGKEGFARRVASGLLEGYLAVEERFETGGRATEQEVIDGLRQVGGRKRTESSRRVVRDMFGVWRACVWWGRSGGGAGLQSQAMEAPILSTPIALVLFTPLHRFVLSPSTEERSPPAWRMRRW